MYIGHSCKAEMILADWHQSAGSLTACCQQCCLHGDVHEHSQLQVLAAQVDAMPAEALLLRPRVQDRSLSRL